MFALLGVGSLKTPQVPAPSVILPLESFTSAGLTNIESTTVTPSGSVKIHHSLPFVCVILKSVWILFALTAPAVSYTHLTPPTR